MVGGGAMLMGSKADQSAPFFAVDAEFAVNVVVDAETALHDANPRLCGTNLQWVDGGDGLLPSGDAFDQDLLHKIKALAPTVIRYPGGSNSDVYQWRTGVGPENSRGRSEHFHRKQKQIVRLGTPEFLSLCELLNAEPLITVNVATGSAKDAGDWVKEINVTGIKSKTNGKKFNPVSFWEIGNEPYLKEDVRPETWTSPLEYAKRANAAIKEMREADPTIRVGLPLRSDSFSGLPVTPYQGFNEQVLKAVHQEFDFVALHNAYLPFVYDRNPEDDETYAALMAAPETVRADLEATRAQLAALQPGAKKMIAITEYSALVTLGRQRDADLSSPAGALYAADLLRLLSTQPDILMANHWSLLGNWYFGTISNTGKLRPFYYVLKAYRALLRGQHVGIEVACRSFAAPKIGLIRSGTNFASVTASATRQNNHVRVILINKDPAANAKVSFRFRSGGKFKSASENALQAHSRFADAEQADAFKVRETVHSPDSDQFQTTLAPASMSLFNFTIAKS